MFGFRACGLMTLGDCSGDALALLGVLSAVALLVSQYARAGQDVLALIERVRAFFRRRDRRTRDYRD